MKTLYLDIGNTNISYFFEKYGVFPMKSIFSEDFYHHFLEHFPGLERIVCASVVPIADVRIAEVAKYYTVEVYNITIGDINIKINIENPSELGIDRAINAAAATQKFGKNVIIIDFGTALTFDIVCNGVYEGGMIFPGLAMAMHNLHTKTAKLPDVKVIKYSIGIGKSTISAIQNSACIGYTGVIKEHINYITHYYNTNFRVVFTGGSGYLFQHIVPNAVFEESLILEYLRLLW